jgi:6-phosphogluconolactonase
MRATCAPLAGSVVKALGALKGTAGVDFSKVHVYFTNERLGGKTFEGDKKDFLEPCGVPLANCHAIVGLEDPVKGAAAYEAAMMGDAKLSKVNGAPSFDIILLGTGDDGHCASINPGSEQVKATSGYVLPIPASDKPGGATVSMALINAAARVVVSASEKKRAVMVQRALTGVFPAHDCPSGLVKSAQGSTTWLCDVDSIAAYKAAK